MGHTGLTGCDDLTNLGSTASFGTYLPTFDCIAPKNGRHAPRFLGCCHVHDKTKSDEATFLHFLFALLHVKTTCGRGPRARVPVLSSVRTASATMQSERALRSGDVMTERATRSSAWPIPRGEARTDVIDRRREESTAGHHHHTTPSALRHCSATTRLRGQNAGLDAAPRRTQDGVRCAPT